MLTRGVPGRPPTALAVGVSLALAGVVIVLGASIAGSYLLMVHYVHLVTVHQEQVQVRAAVGTCRWLRAMNDAGTGAKHVVRYGSASYGLKLSSAIHGLYAHSACPAILSGHYRPAQ